MLSNAPAPHPCNPQVSSRLLYVWLPLLGANLLFMVYMGWVVVPLYTLVSTTCVRNPRALQAHIRRHKKAEAEEEGGITGCVRGGGGDGGECGEDGSREGRGSSF